mgnify:CR=1 FL=1
MAFVSTDLFPVLGIISKDWPAVTGNSFVCYGATDSGFAFELSGGFVESLLIADDNTILS